MYEDETDDELAAIEIAEETTDAWYKRMFDPMIEDLMEDEDAWKLVLPALC